jgi:hypothetical protein
LNVLLPMMDLQKKIMLDQQWFYAIRFVLISTFRLFNCFEYLISMINRFTDQVIQFLQVLKLTYTVCLLVINTLCSILVL